MSAMPCTQDTQGGEVGNTGLCVLQKHTMTQSTAGKRRGLRLFNYVGEIIGELRKVVWLTKREAAYLTALVLIVSICAGIFLGALDFGFTELVDKIFVGN